MNKNINSEVIAYDDSFFILESCIDLSDSSNDCYEESDACYDEVYDSECDCGCLDSDSSDIALINI
jgi:hypothetical protein